ncbi:MAG TPA: trypsin-like peptidase domain-containing protein [Acidimicrobiia bacterium]|nr:trypsin-like peptidase domain-containing protein [Acidimicrobiia bacterium]
MTSPLPPEPVSPERVGPEPPKERRSDPWAIAMGIIGGVLLGTGLTFAILGYVGIFEEPVPPTIPPAPTLTVPPTSPPLTFGDDVSMASVAAHVVPSTVAVQVGSFFGEGSGSGVVYGTDGYIITNNHVIEVGGSISVVFVDGAEFPAQIVGSDPVTDIGVLLVDRGDLSPITVGSSDSLSIGEPTVAVGNPLGLVGGPTVTSGIVSALNRSLEIPGDGILYGLVQTDAPIAPGSSGGALVDASGRLVGITTAIAVSDVGSADLGFAVPTEIAIGVANDLIETGEVRHALLGINGTTAYAEESEARYPVGVLVESVTDGSTYEAAGGRVNDVIVEVGGEDVKTLDALLSRLRRLRAGQSIPVRILRSDANTNLDVTLGLLP